MKLPVLCAFSFSRRRPPRSPVPSAAPARGPINLLFKVASMAAIRHGSSINLTGIFGLPIRTECRVRSPRRTCIPFRGWSVVTGGCCRCDQWQKPRRRYSEARILRCPRITLAPRRCRWCSSFEATAPTVNSNGQMNLEDPMAAFNGNGKVSPAPLETNTVVLIQTNNFNSSIILVDSNSSLGQNGGVTVTPFVIRAAASPIRISPSKACEPVCLLSPPRPQHRRARTRPRPRPRNNFHGVSHIARRAFQALDSEPRTKPCGVHAYRDDRGRCDPYRAHIFGGGRGHSPARGG